MPCLAELIEPMTENERELVHKLTPEEQKRGIEALETARRHAKEVAKRHGVEKFPDSSDILNKLRDERTEQLMRAAFPSEYPADQ